MIPISIQKHFQDRNSNSLAKIRSAFFFFFETSSRGIFTEERFIFMQSVSGAGRVVERNAHSSNLWGRAQSAFHGNAREKV